MVDMYGLFTYVTGVVPLLYTVPISHLGCMRNVRNTEGLWGMYGILKNC